MKRFVAAAAVVGGLFALGCTAEPAPKSKIVDVGGTEPPRGSKGPRSSSSSNGPGGSPSVDDSTPEDPSGEPPPANNPSSPDPGESAPTEPAGPTTASCASASGDNKSVTQIVYQDENGSMMLSSMTVAITNKDHRDKNDVDVWVTPHGGSESKVFNSGDILPDGKTTNVPLPSGFSIKPGSRLRIETNFDERFTDPHASCNIQF